MRKNERKRIPITLAEKEQSIDFILKEVNLQPVTFRRFIQSYFQEVGFRYLFWGMSESLFIVGLLLIGIGIFYVPYLHQLAQDNYNDIYFFVFMASPICYALLYFLGIWKERMLGTFELKMTLRVSLKELLILRMLVFSLMALIVAVGSNLLIWQLMSDTISLLRLFSLSFSSLFLFANTQLLLEYQIPIYFSHWMTPMIWSFVSVLLFFQKVRIVQVVSYLPLSLFIIFGVGLLLLFIYLLRHYYFSEKEGTIIYANT